jgi:hypothetical protein
VGAYRHCSIWYASARFAMVSADNGRVYSILKPVRVALIDFMSNVFAPVGVSFCRPKVSLPSWPQLPPAPSPPT